MQTASYSSLLSLVKGLTGNTTLATSETTLLGEFINRRIFNAYRQYDYWPRYLVLGEERAMADSVVPFTQTTLNSIDTFFRLYDAEPYVTNSVREYDFLVTSDGARVLVNTTSATTVFVDYKKRWEGDYNSTTNTDVPLEFYHYAAHAAAADFLRYNLQTEKAMAEEQYAQSLLILEMTNPMNVKNSMNAGVRIRTHASAQGR